MSDSESSSHAESPSHAESSSHAGSSTEAERSGEWRRVASSEELGCEALIAGDERDYSVVWRTRSGSISAADSRCPHQLANLVHCGRVLGEELICQEHGWRFRNSKKNHKLSAQGKINGKAALSMIAVRESEDAIWIRAELDTDS